MTGRQKFATEHRPTGRTAECPVCERLLITTRAHTIEVATGRIAAVEDHDRFPAHPVRNWLNQPAVAGTPCCEAGDPVLAADHQRGQARLAQGEAA